VLPQMLVHHEVRNVFPMVYVTMVDWLGGVDQEWLVHPKAL